ncbi:hypothetical protein [Phytomonospora endophytica]|uniref:Uncharacterized protein n=1 Tax=Phytomonospora endophytica TaxID=714109 RepID=A0A841FQ22_9ACTN|nr:hypothetical protein [Phytomonospora endophytica]MBB6038225.1 hypothetical protein [Phytomonospora endophytica]GIG67316.1 hypothetical protein Pen01_36110 [Phytomonospora endophytica]
MSDYFEQYGWTRAEVVDALRDSADGDLLAMAALDLIIGHGMWLKRTEFLDCIDIDDEHDAPMWASIDWPRAVGVYTPCSGSERTILRIAASLATRQVEISFALVSGLDATNTRLVMNAIAAATGHRDLIRGEQS